MLKIGDLISTRSIRSYFSSPEAKGSGEYKADKGKHMTFLYLGQEPSDGSHPINPDTVMTLLGWQQQQKSG